MTDLGVAATKSHAVTLAWTEVPDGLDGPASYQVRYAPTPIGYGWGDATVVADGSCASPISGSKVGATLECEARGLDPDTDYDFQLVAFRETSTGTRVYSSELSNVVSTTTSKTIPGTVADLSVEGVSSSSVTVQWTQVQDGNGEPALYQLRYTLSPMDYGWGDATVVSDGSCATPVSGTESGATLSCEITGLDPETSYDIRLVAFRIEDDGSRTYSENLSNVATAETTSGIPGTVSDLGVTNTGSTTASLSWTQVADGRGEPASYEVRYANTPIGYGWGDATVVSSGTCANPISGDQVGSGLTCTVEGLAPDTSHDFQLVAFRVEDDGSRTYSEGLSNAATGVTTAETTDNGGTDSGTTTVSHEPETFSLLAETSYASGSEGGFNSSSNENFSIVDDASAPSSPSTVGQALFPAGLGDGVAPIWSSSWISDYGARRLYMSFWVKVSDNWQGHGTGVNKIGFIWTHEKPVVFPNILGTGSGRLGSEIRIQDVPDGARNLKPNVSDPDIVRGRWHRWEILVVSNTGDAADGEVHWWVDGEKAGEYRDLRFGTSAQSKVWDNVAWRPTWGGRGDTVQQDMHMWMDHFYVSGAQ